MSKKIEMDSAALKRRIDHQLERAGLMIQAGKLPEAKECLDIAARVLRDLQATIAEEISKGGPNGLCCVEMEGGSGFRCIDPAPSSDLRCNVTGLEVPAFLRHQPGPVSLVDAARSQWRGGLS